MAATLGYSSFFSSGLLAPDAPSAPPRGSSPSTPRAAIAALPVDDTTPTAPTTVSGNAANESQVLPSISIPSGDDSRPRLRRRRSSLADSMSPLATMKSSGPIRSATASVQRSLRARSGSDASIMSTASVHSLSSNENVAKNLPKGTGIVGRLRSGSVGTALRARHGLRRIVPAMPARPAPTVPLPDVPPVPQLATILGSPVSVTPASPTPNPRRPLARRAQTSDNYELAAAPFSLGGSSPMCIDTGVNEDVVATLGVRVQRDMQIDYPSPIDGSGPFAWARAEN